MIRQILRSANRCLPTDKRRLTRQPVASFCCQNRASSSIASGTAVADSKKADEKVRLADRATKSLASLDAQFVRLKGDPSLRQFSPTEVLRRSPTFTDVEWGEYIHLCAGNMKKSSSHILMDINRMKDVIEIRNRACDWLTKNVDSVKPRQYFNFLRYLQAVTVKRRNNRSQTDLPQFIDPYASVSQWFMKHYSTLKSLAFFEILNEKTRFLVHHKLLEREAIDDCLKVIDHGIKLAQKEETEINNILHLLYTVELYRQLFKDEAKLSLFAERLVDILKKKDMPVNSKDLLETMTFLSEIKQPMDSLLTNRAVFRQHAKGDGGEWRWLRNAINLVFDEEEYASLRQMAAVAAVRAYKWKAADFTPDDMERFLQMAAEPIFANPSAAYFDSPMKEEVSLSSANRLKALIVAVRSASHSDLPQLGKLPVQVDDAFWDRFFDAVENNSSESEKRVGELMTLARVIEPHMPKPTEKTVFIAPLFNKERKERLRKIVNQGFRKGT
uniref:ATPase expression protein 2, mitochondrial n=1 Tax=Plectus sambesii TaxID=2011161 RepID=A0A914WM98_9BILA